MLNNYIEFDDENGMAKRLKMETEEDAVAKELNSLNLFDSQKSE